jgi:hypothetical protein
VHVRPLLRILASTTTCFWSFTAASQTPNVPASNSLKEKSDTQLLQLITGTETPVTQRADPPYDDRVIPSPLDRLWEMDPREAALAFVSDYVDKGITGVRFEIDDMNAKPPAKGEIHLRWISGNEYAPPKEGLTVLIFDGYSSRLLTSQVELVGRPSKQQVESAVAKADSHALRPRVAQQTYEILWWLGHVRMIGTPSAYTSPTYSSGDDFGRFWMKPNGPVIEKAIFGAPCGQCIGEKEHTSYESFADTLIRRLTQRSGIKERYPIPKVIHYADTDSDSVFYRTHPPPRSDDKPATRQWVGRLLEILRNPNRDFLYWNVMETLVPISDPFRYDDERIDSTLLDFLRRCEKAASSPEFQEKQFDELNPSNFPSAEALKRALKERERVREKERLMQRRKSDVEIYIQTAAQKLGLRGAAPAFAEVLRLAPRDSAPIAVRHPELRQLLVNYLEPVNAQPRSHWPNSYVVEIIWRADFREFTPFLKKLASETDKSQDAAQEAKAVLLAWEETDPLTKTKLDIMLTGKIGGGGAIPDLLRIEFAGLSKEDQLKVRSFINWMRTVDVPWSRRYIENTFTPHTPRPDILFER